MLVNHPTQHQQQLTTIIPILAAHLLAPFPQQTFHPSINHSCKFYHHFQLQVLSSLSIASLYIRVCQHFNYNDPYLLFTCLMFKYACFDC
mmetsp:Transcript_33094/g.53111  ORF Transcript_33094/g.53111 Transcript_33094/m.53111 type:complete len:90 (+) Transcript_33094:2340-2609(+)